jgi:hypothetical protein
MRNAGLSSGDIIQKKPRIIIGQVDGSGTGLIAKSSIAKSFPLAALSASAILKLNGPPAMFFCSREG